jgi:DNA sulfur modification protein DndD
MIIQSVQIENFRSFYGTQIIEFSAENKKNTTFIWANNNVGKTNLLNAITWCLHNLFTSSFKKSEDLLNHQAKDNGRNNYSVVIIFRESDKTFSVKRSGGSFSGFHVHEIMPDGDFKEVSSPALFINSILPKEMMRYFIIDGEGISESVDSKGQISAERSIKDILGFQVAEKTLEDLKNIRQSHNKELGRLDVGSDLTKKQNEFDAIDDSVSNKIKELAGLEESLKEYQDQFESSDLYLKESNHEVVKLKTRQRDDLHVQIRESENELKSLENAKVNLIRKYSWVAFSDKLSEEAMDFIDESQFKGTIPAPFNESLVKDILDESRCICGAEITPGMHIFPIAF